MCVCVCVCGARAVSHNWPEAARGVSLCSRLPEMVFGFLRSKGVTAIDVAVGVAIGVISGVYIFLPPLREASAAREAAAATGGAKTSAAAAAAGSRAASAMPPPPAAATAPSIVPVVPSGPR